VESLFPPGCLVVDLVEVSNWDRPPHVLASRQVRVGSVVPPAPTGSRMRGARLLQAADGCLVLPPLVVRRPPLRLAHLGRRKPIDVPRTLLWVAVV
jgi:hypothetical protein